MVFTRFEIVAEADVKSEIEVVASVETPNTFKFPVLVVEDTVNDDTLA